jgi:YD repeat-containing protein
MHEPVASPVPFSIRRHTVQSVALLFWASCLCLPAESAEETVYTNQNKLFQSTRQVTALGPSLFGDRVSLYTGALEFVQTDVSLPGNNRLPVSVGRRLVAGQESRSGLFGTWDLEIPHLHGVFSDKLGWVPATGLASARCSDFSKPPPVQESSGLNGNWSGTEYWHGSFLYIPGQGDQELLKRSSSYPDAPTGNASYTFPVVTRQDWQIRCIASMDSLNGSPGEAFVAVSPDGTEYRFDWMVSRPLPILKKTDPAPAQDGEALLRGEMSSVSIGDEPSSLMAGDPIVLNRKEVWILPTRVTDRFGNAVIYTYDPTKKWQVKTIESQDGTGSARKITFSYLSSDTSPVGRVSSISDGTRTWNYSYTSDGKAALQTVTLPDNSAWQLAGLNELQYDINYQGSGTCDSPGIPIQETRTGEAKHPSGAEAEFVIAPTRHARVGVPRECLTYAEPMSESVVYPNQFDTYALTTKTISGPGLPAMTWDTTYSAAMPGWAPWNGQDGTKQVEVRDPDGSSTRHTFGTVYMQTEGQLQLTERFDNSGSPVRSTALNYTQIALPKGISEQRRGDGEMAARSVETSRREIVQQGTSFVWEATAFNLPFSQPTRVKRSSSQGGAGSRVDVMSYEDNREKWVIGQVKTVTDEASGKQLQQNSYNRSSANLESISRFGLVEKSMSYNADGTLASEKDGLNQETRYSNYRRGIPQNVTFADGKAASAAVNNLGGLDSVTDATGATSYFGYDAMGRFKSITYPSEVAGTPVNWNATTLSFEQVWTAEYDLIPGHWRQTVTTGTGIEANYFDAFWRPMYSERWDNNNRTGTRRIVKHQYDAEGRTVFDSYPAGTDGDMLYGVRRNYDALGRLVLTEADSELGLLRSTVWYNPSAFQKVQTDARGHATTYGFQVFDQPSEEAITDIAAPKAVSLQIARDPFGKPLAITRSGNGKSVTRSYGYDTFERLVKTTEPETGATLQGYDAANNVVCRATGLSLVAASACDAANVPATKRTSFGYDLRNRLKTTNYGDGSPAISRTWTADGLLETISSGGAVWTYEYNRRRLNTGETLAYGGATYRIGRSYDANGSLAQLQYPRDNLVINYDPNALGQARKVGGYATGIDYLPGGAVKGFTYGNGIRRDFRQNRRGLPERSTDAGVLDETYAYDENGNVAKIDDNTAGGASRAMQYDELDRLWIVSAPNLGGTATYDYDAIDNLVSTTITGGANARTLIHKFNTDTNRLDSVSGGPAAFNFAYTYDDQGNVTQRGSRTYSFDQGNRLKAAVGIATYAYDGLGHRFSTVDTGGVNTIQVYTQDGKLLYSGPSGGGGTKYIYLNNHVIAEVK